MLLCITAGVVAVAIAVPVLSRICGICSKDDDDADAEHSKVASNSVLTKLVGWVNEVKDGEDKAEDDDDKGYEEMSVRDFESSQSL